MAKIEIKDLKGFEDYYAGSDGLIYTTKKSPRYNPKGKEVNHKDGDKHNNHPSNLEYMTRSENQLHYHHITKPRRNAN